MNNTAERIKQIETENFIWLVYLFIIAMSYHANYYEKNYFLTNNLASKEKYRKINIFIFCLLTVIYGYFEKDAYTQFVSKKTSKKKQTLDNLSFIASTLILVSGFIFLYIIVEDTDLEEEIAFN